MPWRTQDAGLGRNRRGCFNSATALMPWRTGPRVVRPGEHLRGLQFGHGFDAVEDVGAGGPRPTPAGRFNSATALMPWRTEKGGGEEAAGRRFNSATAL